MPILLITTIILALLLTGFIAIFIALILKQRKKDLEHFKEKTTLSEQVERYKQQLQDHENLHKLTEERFYDLSQRVFIHNQEHFLDLANKSIEQNLKLWSEQQNHLVTGQKNNFEKIIDPVREHLTALDKKNNELENRWVSTYSSLKQVLEHQKQSVDELSEQTQKLARTLYSSQDRGAWGELQLQRIVELAGMQRYCDFAQQVSMSNSDGQASRPDAIIYLPQNRHIIIDAKAPVQEGSDETTTQNLAQALKRHITQLAQKKYWDCDQQSPDFVILFIPTESTLQQALSAQPQILEEAAQKGIILASPASLIAMLKCIHMAWRQANLQENMKEAVELSKQLLERINILSGHFQDLRKNLSKAGESFNKAMGAYENRVLTTAKKMSVLCHGEEKIIKQVDTEQLPRLKTCKQEEL